MPEEIVNRVAQSALELFDLAEYWPSQGVRTLDLTHLATDGILREAHVREVLQSIDVAPYQHTVVVCTLPEAIAPQWLWPLLGSVLHEAAYVSTGTKQDALSAYYAKKLSTIDWSQWQDSKVLLKGCADVEIPETAYIQAAQELSRVADKLMYGEACSFVPIFKSNAPQ